MGRPPCRVTGPHKERLTKADEVCYLCPILLSPSLICPHGHYLCYRLSKRPNCFHGTCSGLGTWQPRCTEDASSGTRHVVPLPLLSLIAHVTVLLNGGANPMMPALSTTRASAPVPVPFPQLSPHVPSYRPITPSPCALGQQVIAVLSHAIVSVSPRVLLPGS